MTDPQPEAQPDQPVPASVWQYFANYIREYDDTLRYHDSAAWWGKRGLSTDPADRDAAERAIVDLYAYRRLGGGRKPRIIWADSPHAARRTADDVVAQGTAWQCAREDVMPESELYVLGRNHRIDWGRVQQPLRLLRAARRVGEQVLAATDLIASTTLGPFHTLRMKSHPVVPGQFDAEALARYELELMKEEALSTAVHYGAWHALLQIARSAGPWWPFESIVIISERPKAIHLDAELRLHADSGPAVLYPDGWGVHAWHDTVVPASLIEGPPWTPAQVLTERNVEVRRAAIERIGWDRFVESDILQPLGPAVPDPGNPGQELRLYVPAVRIYDRPVLVLVCTNGSLERDGTRRRFGLTVPASFTNPVAAAAWTFGWTREQYAALEHRR